MIRILLFQQPDYQDVLVFFLRNSGNFHVMSCDSPQDLSRQIHQGQPHIVLLDIALGEQLIEKIKALAPAVKVVVLTNDSQHTTVLAMMRKGADGYLIIEKTDLAKLPDYLVEANQGGVPMNPLLVAVVMKELKSIAEVSQISESLTKRESEILKLLVDGLTYKAVSFTLNIALDTTRSHIKSIYSKLKVNSKSEAVVKALRNTSILV